MPQFAIFPYRILEICFLRMLSSVKFDFRRIAGHFPPKERVRGVMLDPTCLVEQQIDRATSREPVKRMWSNRNLSIKDFAISGPPLTIPRARESMYCGNRVTSNRSTCGVASEGFNKTQLPAAIGPISDSMQIPKGRLQGAIARTNPLGYG